VPFPAHDDQTPSLSIRQGDKGILVKCFAGCDSLDVLREISRLGSMSNVSAPDPADRDLRPSVNVLKIWSEGIDTSGTLAERYLASCGIDRPFQQLRFHPRCPKGRYPLTTFTPALLVAVQTAREILAIQRVFLNRNNFYSKKLIVDRRAKGSPLEG
jgi:hypothetical protein